MRVHSRRNGTAALVETSCFSRGRGGRESELSKGGHPLWVPSLVTDETWPSMPCDRQPLPEDGHWQGKGQLPLWPREGAARQGAGHPARRALLPPSGGCWLLPRCALSSGLAPQGCSSLCFCLRVAAGVVLAVFCRKVNGTSETSGQARSRPQEEALETTDPTPLTGATVEAGTLGVPRFRQHQAHTRPAGGSLLLPARPSGSVLHIAELSECEQGLMGFPSGVGCAGDPRESVCRGPTQDAAGGSS